MLLAWITTGFIHAFMKSHYVTATSILETSFEQMLQLSKNSETDATMLQRMRDNYATASAAQRVQLRQTILQLEQNNETQRQQLRQLEKDIRNAEISNQ